MMGLLNRQRQGTAVGFGSGLSKEEKEAIKETFEIFDKDADGYLSPQELKRCLEGKISIDVSRFDWRVAFRSRTASNRRRHPQNDK